MKSWRSEGFWQLWKNISKASEANKNQEDDAEGVKVEMT